MPGKHPARIRPARVRGRKPEGRKQRRQRRQRTLKTLRTLSRLRTPHPPKQPRSRTPAARKSSPSLSLFEFNAGWRITDIARTSAIRATALILLTNGILELQRLQVGAEGLAEIRVLERHLDRSFQETQFVSRVVGSALVDMGQESMLLD